MKHQMPARKTEFVNLWSEGRSRQFIADYFGWSNVQEVYYWRIKFGLAPRHRGPTPEQVEAILAQAGRKVAHIARDIGIAPVAVARILQQAGAYEPTQRESENPDWAGADARWRSVAGGIRYEDARERPWSPTRFSLGGEAPMTCAAALVVDS